MSDQKDQPTDVVRVPTPGEAKAATRGPKSDKGATTDVVRAVPGGVLRPGGTIPPSRMSSFNERRGAQARRLTMTIAISTFVHLVVFAVWAFFPTDTKSPAINLDEAIVKARLVKLGKPRDPKLLPRIPTAPPPAPAEKKAPPVLEPPTAPDKEKIEPEKKSASDILDQFKTENQKPRDLNDLIRDSVGEPDDEGQEFGDAEGTALDGEVTDSYFARVTARIINSMELSSVLSDEERVRLKAVLCLKIGEAGEVSDIKVATGSGSTVFDSDVTAAARRSSPLPAPPPPARARAAASVCFNVCPLSCN